VYRNLNPDVVMMKSDGNPSHSPASLVKQQPIKNSFVIARPGGFIDLLRKESGSGQEYRQAPI
jgi:hypothetical protein